MQKITYFFILYLLNGSFLLAQNTSLKRLSDSINTYADEYWPSITADDSTLIFNRLIGTGYLKQEDFYYSTKDSLGHWKMALPINELNTEGNEGAQSISANGRFMVFTACGRRDGFGSCDLYYSIKIGNKWLPPRNMGKTINTRFWEAQPSISADGKTLYFVSNRPKGKGGMDIWYSRLLSISEEGTLLWSEPENININTEKNEMSPFIHSDNETLYFSSQSYENLGGLDIFMCQKDSVGFSTPKNLGAPINTAGDEMGFIVNSKGNTAYFSSDRNQNNKDIYSYIIPTKLRPNKVLYIKGKVLSSNKKAPLLANLQLQNLSNRANNYQTFSDIESGEYLLCIPTGKQWRLTAQSNGFLFYSETIDLREVDKLHHQKDIVLSAIEYGAKIQLNSIFFDTDKATLKPKSLAELQDIKSLMQQNPELKIELSGHTDNQGNYKYNMLLSQKRANAVFDWLVAQGVSSDRLSAKGYGTMYPKATNETVQGRKQNRRTELKVTDY